MKAWIRGPLLREWNACAGFSLPAYITILFCFYFWAKKGRRRRRKKGMERLAGIEEKTKKKQQQQLSMAIDWHFFKGEGRFPARRTKLRSSCQNEIEFPLLKENSEKLNFFFFELIISSEFFNMRRLLLTLILHD